MSVKSENSRLKKQGSTKRGYTLVELIVVMVILALLAVIVTPLVFNQLSNARSRAAQTQIANLATSLSYYRLDTGRFPDSSAGLDSLVSAPANSTGWAGPYISGNGGIPDDPWGNPYIYEYVGPGHVIIRSLGGDGAEGGEGEDADISRDVR